MAEPLEYCFQYLFSPRHKVLYFVLCRLAALCVVTNIANIGKMLIKAPLRDVDRIIIAQGLIQV